MNLIRLATAAFVMALSGCAITTLHPVGEKPALIDPEELNGTWIGEKGKAWIVEVVDRDNGVLRVVRVVEEKGEPKLVMFTAYLRTAGHQTFISLKGIDASIGDRYSWLGAVSRFGDEVFIWHPNVFEFRRLVRAGILSGVVEDKKYETQVTLTELTSEQMALAESHLRDAMFVWEYPTILTRARGFKEPKERDAPKDGAYGDIVRLHEWEHKSESVAALEALVVQTPDDWRPLRALAKLYATYPTYSYIPSNRARSLEYAERARDLNPQDPFIYEILAAAYYTNCRIADGNAAIEKGIGMATNRETRVVLTGQQFILRSTLRPADCALLP